MTAGAGAAGTAASAAHLIGEAIKASGAIVRVEPDVFEEIVYRQEEPLVVTTTGGFLTTKYRYLCNYKGLTFYTKSAAELRLPPQSQVIAAKKIWVPD